MSDLLTHWAVFEDLRRISQRDPAIDDPSLSADEARQRMLDAISPIAHAEMVPVRNALGRILAADLIAPYDVPAHDNSAMDGYAVRSVDVALPPARLSVVGSAPAGRPFAGDLKAGEAVRIFTGGAALSHRLTFTG